MLSIFRKNLMAFYYDKFNVIFFLILHVIYLIIGPFMVIFIELLFFISCLP